MPEIVSDWTYVLLKGILLLEDCFPAVAGLLDEAPAINDVQVVHSSTSRVILSRVAVVVGVVLVVGVLIAVRLFVHVQSKIDFALLCIPTNSSDTDLLSARYTSTLYSNVTLPPCNMTSTVHLPASTWAAYVRNWAIIYQLAFHTIKGVLSPTVFLR